MSLTICTYLLARTTRGCIIYDKFPSKYLVNNKYILAYLLFPKYKVTKWLFTLHISQLVLCIHNSWSDVSEIFIWTQKTINQYLKNTLGRFDLPIFLKK